MAPSLASTRLVACDGVQNLRDLPHGEGLREKSSGARATDAIRIDATCMTGHEDDRDLRQASLQRLTQLDSVHLRHGNVAEDYVRGILTRGG